MVPVSQLKSELKQLKKLDGGSLFRSPKFSVFGSTSHQYKINLRLSQTEISDFETRQCVDLPSDYQAFLKEVGNGGAGPGYGLLKLQERFIELETPSQNFLSIPFPYTTKWNMERSFNEKQEDYTETKEFKEWENEYFNNKHITGSIRISHYGCAIYYFLVVTGIDKGFIWIDDRANDSGLSPVLSKTSNLKMTFSDWYHEWMEENIMSFKC